jgi:hypothetical protein
MIARQLIGLKFRRFGQNRDAANPVARKLVAAIALAARLENVPVLSGLHRDSDCPKNFNICSREKMSLGIIL